MFTSQAPSPPGSATQLLPTADRSSHSGKLLASPSCNLPENSLLTHFLKSYRGVATRYDKLAALFLGGVLAALLAISLKSIVNTP